jgi:outer membrane protein OmpA-like peptidoglycan-associated protein
MTFKKIFMSAALIAGCFTASAQEPQAEQTASAESKTVTVFSPHWYLQGQIGGQYTLGEVSFGDLLSGNVQVAAGYNFTPVWGLRLSLDAWQSKGGSNLRYLTLGEQTWKYRFIAPSIDATFDLTNCILGYKPDRICNFGLLAGVGLNIAWHNGEANNVYNLVASKSIAGREVPKEHLMTYLWNGTTTRVFGKFGAYLDFKVSRRIALGLEVNGNFLSDTYNSKDAGNTDWYFNALAGVKIRLGKVDKKQVVTAPEPVIIEKIVEVEKPVEKIIEIEKPVEVEKVLPRDPMRRDIFYTIRGSEISKAEKVKIEDVANYLKKYPDATVSVTGYADKGTGNPRINVDFARKRADAVANILINTYGISPSRIFVDSKGDTVQPYEQNELNRVTICIAQ